MRWHRVELIVALSCLAFARVARGEAAQQPYGAAGYLRIATRPDFEGAGGQLGYWNLYGRLLNEGPYAALDLKLDLLQEQAGSDAPWTTLHARVEGGSVQGADTGNGSLANFRVSQLYVQAGNLLLKNLTWQFGTLYDYWGDLGLYDMRPAQLFTGTVGASARYQTKTVNLLVGLGDSGYAIRGAQYDTIFTGGASLLVHVSNHFEIGVGGELMYEPSVVGNKYAPYATPGIDYADFVRGEVAKSYLEAHPADSDFFPKPVPRSSEFGKLVGYLGFGGLGPLEWDSFYVHLKRFPPDQFTTETYGGKTYTIYVHDITDDRYELQAGNEARFKLIPERLELAWGLLYGHEWDNDNRVAPSDYARVYASTVVRLETFITDTLHFLIEGSAAYEDSLNGNEYRDHWDSIFANTDGVSDPRGLQHGDSPVRVTEQLKVGPVFSPLGTGIYTRPSLRLLYGLQHSTQNNAFGNSFVTTLDENNTFQTVERHWHQVIALEAEAWF